MVRALVVLIALPAVVSADQILLKGGGRLDGIVVQRSEAAIVIEIGAGRVTVPASQVNRVIEGESPLSLFQVRAARLAAEDTSAWLDLARWAAEQDLSTQARAAYEQVRRVDPQNAEANRALGLTLLDGSWVSREEAMVAKGYVAFEGEWVTPAERAAAIAERTSLRREREEMAFAEQRIAEAQARAREAEARARQAEAEVRAQESPLVPPYGGLAFYSGSPFYSGSFYSGSPFYNSPHVAPRCDTRTTGFSVTVSTDTPRAEPRRRSADRRSRRR